MIKLTQLRFDAGLSPDELSRRIKLEKGRTISAKSIRAIEGGSTPRAANAKLLADFFGTTPTDLMRSANNGHDDPDLAPAA